MRPIPGMIVALLAGIMFCACSSTPATPSKPAIAADRLDTAEAYLQRGNAYFGKKDYEHAIDDYTQAIRLKPDYAEAYYNRGYAFAMEGKGGLADAIMDYSQAILLRPDYANAYNNRGQAYMAGGNLDEALQDFTRLIQLQPDFPRAHSNRGSAYFRKGQLLPAIADFYLAGKFKAGFIVLISAIFVLVFWIVIRDTLRLRKTGPAK